MLLPDGTYVRTFGTIVAVLFDSLYFTAPVLQQNTTLPEPESADVLPQAHRYCVLVRSPLTLCSFDDVRVCRGRVAFARADEGTRRASRNAVLRSHRKIQDSSRVRVEY